MKPRKTKNKIQIAKLLNSVLLLGNPVFFVAFFAHHVHQGQVRRQPQVSVQQRARPPGQEDLRHAKAPHRSVSPVHSSSPILTLFSRTDQFVSYCLLYIKYCTFTNTHSTQTNHCPFLVTFNELNLPEIYAFRLVFLFISPFCLFLSRFIYSHSSWYTKNKNLFGQKQRNSESALSKIRIWTSEIRFKPA